LIDAARDPPFRVPDAEPLPPLPNVVPDDDGASLLTLLPLQKGLGERPVWLPYGKRAQACVFESGFVLIAAARSIGAVTQSSKDDLALKATEWLAEEILELL
jgi:hypothetical protein